MPTGSCFAAGVQCSFIRPSVRATGLLVEFWVESCGEGRNRDFRKFARGDFWLLVFKILNSDLLINNLLITMKILTIWEFDLGRLRVFKSAVHVSVIFRSLFIKRSINVGSRKFGMLDFLSAVLVSRNVVLGKKCLACGEPKGVTTVVRIGTVTGHARNSSRRFGVPMRCPPQGGRTP